MASPPPGQPVPPPSAYARFWQRPDVMSVVIVAGVSLNFGLSFLLRAEPPAEVVHRLEVADTTYVLGFHRYDGGYNTVMRDGVLVFDARERRAGLCLRLHAGADGGVEVECHEPGRPVVRRFPVTPVPAR